jgi:hypothetical protein
MLIVKWFDRGVWPKVAPDPDYPDGLDLDLSRDASATCDTALPYPAKRCGWYVVTCDRCGRSVGITTAGRADDPRSVKLPCKPQA